MSKKILSIILIILFVALLGLGYYFFFVKNTTTDQIEDTNQDFFPISSGNGNNQNTDNTPINNSGNDSLPVDENIFKKITDVPVSGATIFDRGDSTIIRYVDKATGNIFEASRYTDEKSRISNKTIPKIYNAVFGKDGNYAIIQYLRDNSSDIVSFSLEIDSATTTGNFGEIKSNPLPNNIKTLSFSPSKDNLFYLINNTSNSNGIISKPDGTGKIQLLNSSLKELNANWSSQSKITLTTKPSGLSSGYSFLLDSKTGDMQKILSGLTGLTNIFNKSSTKGIVSTGGNSIMRTFAYNIKSRSVDEFFIKTISDKCVFDPQNDDIAYCAVPREIPTGLYPDDWYKGIVSFNDNFWKLNLSDGSAIVIAEASFAGEDFDAINISIDEKGKELIFTNKKDSNLWSLKIPSR